MPSRHRSRTCWLVRACAARRAGARAGVCRRTAACGSGRAPSRIQYAMPLSLPTRFSRKTGDRVQIFPVLRTSKRLTIFHRGLSSCAASLPSGETPHPDFAKSRTERRRIRFCDLQPQMGNVWCAKPKKSVPRGWFSRPTPRPTPARPCFRSSPLARPRADQRPEQTPIRIDLGKTRMRDGAPKAPPRMRRKYGLAPYSQYAAIASRRNSAAPGAIAS